MAKFDNFRQYINARTSFTNKDEALEFFQEHYLLDNSFNFLQKKLELLDNITLQNEIALLLSKHQYYYKALPSLLHNFAHNIMYYNFSLKYVKNTPTAKLFLCKLYNSNNSLLNNKMLKRFSLLVAFQIATKMSDGNDLKKLYGTIAKIESISTKQIFKYVNNEVSYILKASNSGEALKKFTLFAKRYI